MLPTGTTRSRRDPECPWVFARAGKRIACLIGAIELALQVRRERQILLAMNDRMLKDLGLNGSAYAEATRPFWDVPADRLHLEAARRCGRSG